MNVDVGLIAVLVTVLLALTGFAFGYGILTSRQKADRYDIEELKSSYKILDEKLDNIQNTVTRIDSRFGGDK